MSIADVEEPRRLKPTPETLRKLFAHSGNLCAYPKCMEVMIDASGELQGQIAHIEAVERGGPRFNPRMTNEERRRPENLMLMCYKHHKLVDDHPKEYPVLIMQMMKDQHEHRFINPAIAIGKALVDWDDTPLMTPPRNLKYFLVKRRLKFLNVESERQFLAMVQEAIRRLAQVNYKDREVFEILCSKIADGGSVEVGVLPESVFRTGLDLSKEQVQDHFANLQHYRLAELDLEDYPHTKPRLVVYNVDDYPFFTELVLFAREVGAPLSLYFNQLNFSSLDYPE